MPKRPRPNTGLENARRERAVQVEAELIIEQINKYDQHIHEDLELDIEGNKIQVRQFRDFIVDRLQADFKEELDDYVDYVMETKSDQLVTRQNAIRPEDFEMIRNTPLSIKHPWQAAEWQKQVLQDYLNRSSRKVKL